MPLQYIQVEAAENNEADEDKDKTVNISVLVGGVAGGVAAVVLPFASYRHRAGATRAPFFPEQQ